MKNEVIERIELVVQCAGSRRISKENLSFMFDKYDLSQEDRTAVLSYCEENRIQIFEEYTPSSEDEKGENSTSSGASKGKEKRSFFARLFGR